MDQSGVGLGRGSECLLGASRLWGVDGAERAQICLPVSPQGLREPLAGEALGHP